MPPARTGVPAAQAGLRQPSAAQGPNKKQARPEPLEERKRPAARAGTVHEDRGPPVQQGRGTEEHAGPARGSPSPAPGGTQGGAPVILQHATPTHVSRLQRARLREQAGSHGDAVHGEVASRLAGSVPVSAHASPAISEMVYELRPVAPQQASPAAKAASMLDSQSACASSGGSKALQHDWAAGLRHSQDHEAGEQRQVASGGSSNSGVQRMHRSESQPRVASDIVQYASLAPSRQASGAEDAAPDQDSGRLPEYSGFSEEMRAAANAAAEALLAEDSASFAGQRALHAGRQAAGGMDEGLLAEDSASFAGQRALHAGRQAAGSMDEGLLAEDSASFAGQRALHAGRQAAGGMDEGPSAEGGLPASPHGGHEEQGAGGEWDAEAYAGEDGVYGALADEHLTLEELEARIGELQRTMSEDDDAADGQWHSSAHGSGKGSCDLERRVHAEKRGGGRAGMEEFERLEGEVWGKAAGEEQCEAEADARMRAVCAVNSNLFQKKARSVHEDGSRSAFPALAQSHDEPRMHSGMSWPGEAAPQSSSASLWPACIVCFADAIRC